MTSALSQLLSDLVALGAVSAASAIIGDADQPLASAQAGWADRARQEPLGRHHRLDLASLTKPWTATLALALDQRGLVPLGLPVGEIWTTAPPALARQPLERLLRHRSGLKPWLPLYQQVPDPGQAIAWLLRQGSSGAAQPTYSDLGYMLWARSAERLLNDSLAVLLRRYVLRPLGSSTVEAAPRGSRCAASLLGNEREVELAAALGVAVARQLGPEQGVPQDGNARFLGGLPGHAGLFAPAHALWRLGAEWLEPSRVISARASARALAGSGRYRLGWWRRDAARSATRALSAESYGHHGFTGGSVWIDPERRRVAVLLAHRVSTEVDLDPWRRRFHQLAVA